MLIAWAHQQAAASPPAWTPLDLGAKLLAWWDAEYAPGLSLTGNLVDSWTDRKSGYVVSQTLSGSKPSLNVIGMNNRPAIVFDGVDDHLFTLTQPLPSGATPADLWLLAGQDVLAGVTGTRIPIMYGSTVNGLTARYIRRTVIAGVNRASQSIGNGATQSIIQDATVDLTGNHVIWGEGTGTENRISCDGQAKVMAAVAQSLAAVGALAIGSNNTRLSNYWQGPVNSIIVTQPLTNPEATQLMTFLKSRGGIA